MRYPSNPEARRTARAILAALDEVVRRELHRELEAERQRELVARLKTRQVTESR